MNCHHTIKSNVISAVAHINKYTNSEDINQIDFDLYYVKDLKCQRCGYFISLVLLRDTLTNLLNIAFLPKSTRKVIECKQMRVSKKDIKRAESNCERFGLIKKKVCRCFSVVQNKYAAVAAILKYMQTYKIAMLPLEMIPMACVSGMKCYNCKNAIKFYMDVIIMENGIHDIIVATKNPSEHPKREYYVNYGMFKLTKEDFMYAEMCCNPEHIIY